MTDLDQDDWPDPPDVCEAEILDDDDRSVAEEHRRTGPVRQLVRSGPLRVVGRSSTTLASRATATSNLPTASSARTDDSSGFDEDVIKILVTRRRHALEAKRRVDAELMPPPAPPEFATLAERLRMPRVVTAWRIGGWLPRRARALLVAQFKAGKTTVTGNVSRSLVDGDLFLGVAPVEPLVGNLAILDTEMSSYQLEDWLRDQIIQNTSRVHIATLRGNVASLNLLDPAVRAQWADWLRERNVEFLILDCLRPVLDVLGLDEQHEVGKFLVAFDALLREADIAEAIVVHHMGHSGERARGDSRLRDWPDVEWTLTRASEDPSSARYIKAFGRDVNVEESQLKYDARRLTLVEGSRRDAGLGSALAAVLSVLEASQEPISFRGLQDAAVERGVSRNLARAAIKHGVACQAIVTEPGPKRSLLHRRGPMEVPDA